MANHISSKKRIRRNERRAVINKNRLSRVRTFVKKVEAAIEAGNKDEAQAAFLAAMPELHRGASRGVMHRNTVSRKTSRLAAKIKAM
ncbi:30S ribosomal protein S20 [Oleispirillum naphthae]|uniref:30S ribosomal protein S20 n=1 Tax=Oleispirillum naphthae TaxID=2838853 RepID=UPI0030823888